MSDRITGERFRQEGGLTQFVRADVSWRCLDGQVAACPSAACPGGRGRPAARRTIRARAAQGSRFQRLARVFTWLAVDPEEGDGPLPEFVKAELEGFAGCGDFARGFVRTACRTCRDELRVPLACRGPGFCPSCMGGCPRARRSWSTTSCPPPYGLLWDGSRCTMTREPYEAEHQLSSSDPGNRALYFDILKDLRKAFSHKTCLAPSAMKSECAGQIIAAHSIQRNGCGLNKIAENGHVLSPAPHHDGTAAMVRIGINRASTFTGFCGYHDARIFAPIEMAPLTFTEQQVFLLLYRAFCKEYFAKIGANEHAQKLLARETPGHRRVESFAAGVDVGLFELQRYKEAIDAMLLASDWSRLRYVMYEMDRTPEFCTAAWLSIDYGFQGQVIQNVGDPSTPLHGTMFSVVPVETGGYVVFAWIDDHKSATRFTRSLERVPVEQLPEHLLHFTFEYAENVFCSPTWWQSLSADAQDSLARHFLSGATSRSPRERHWLVLRPRIDPGWRIVNQHRKNAP